MRNSCPFHGNTVIHHHIRAVVHFIQAFVLLTQNLRRQGLPGGSHGTDVPLKFREHGLAVDRALELVKEVVDEVRPFLFIRGVFQQVLHEQSLVAG